MAEALSQDDMDKLAAEFVLGLLDPEERASTQVLIDGNGMMRALAARWQERVAPMHILYRPVAAPDIWPALDAQLFAPRRRRNRLFLLGAAGLLVALLVKIGFWLQLLG